LYARAGWTGRIEEGWNMVGKILTVALSAALVLTVTGAAPAGAKAGDVIKRGSCSASSDWKLKLSPEDNGIQAEFEVDSNRSGQAWTVKLFHEGHKILHGTRRTGGASDSFTVRKVANDTSGTDSYRARAMNKSTGETCVGRASI
jgi:hypothetical protein